MKEFYITFGQQHTHRHNGQTLDRDVIGVIKAEDMNKARELAFKWFGDEWFSTYSSIREQDLKFFPRGFINLN